MLENTLGINLRNNLLAISIEFSLLYSNTSYLTKIELCNLIIHLTYKAWFLMTAVYSPSEICPLAVKIG